MRVMCIECGGKGRIKKTYRMSQGVANLYCQCTDPTCGHTWVSTLSFSHTLTPSAKQSGDMALALSRGLSPDEHRKLHETVTERQKILDAEAEIERQKPVVIIRRAL
ncbi:Ogr/Delta-like zinc finger protein [Aeromonas enteropelogenes]